MRKMKKQTIRAVILLMVFFLVPANQIVHVVVDEKMSRESNGFFEMVSVTGTVFTKRATKSLFLNDDTSDINIGYSMQASMVEPSKEKPRKQMEPST
jgi:hypothetical protein